MTYFGEDVMKKTVILNENIHGIKIIREDYVRRSKVCVRSRDGYHIHTYRFNNLEKTFDSPYVSWANLDCCNGWYYDKEYLITSVPMGKKLYAGITFSKQDYDEIEKEKYLEVIESLTDEFVTGYEIERNCNFTSYFICRKGTLRDYYNLNEVIDFYKKLGLYLNDNIIQQLTEYFSYELSDFSNEIPFDYVNPRSIAQYIITGLLLGYPLESTCSILGY